MNRDPRDPTTLPRLSITRRAALTGVAAATAFASTARWSSAFAQATPANPVTSHPRLWLTEADLPRLRGWATEDNPVWQEGVAVLAEQAVAEMDAGTVPNEDEGSYLWEEFPTESYAEFFTFLSLVHPDEATRQDYAGRARTLLMHAIGEAAKGQGESETPFRQPDFATNDRSRWWGECWALAVDWIYPILSADDKTTIREVFLRWSDEIVQTGYHSPGDDDPSLVGVTNAPILLADRGAVRWAGNNYFTGNMRNLGLMAMALDPDDDPDGALGAYLEIATGAYLYMVDDLFRTDAAGGLAPEGFEYSPQSVGYVAQFLLALHTARQDDSATWGPQVVLPDNPFWDDVVPAWFHSLSPATVVVPEWEYKGPVYQPAWYGDGQDYWAPDAIELFGALGRYDDLTGNADRLAAIRWLQTHTPPGGAPEMIPERIGDASTHHDAILYFLLFDPDTPEPADPRPGLPLAFFAPGIGRLLVRTGWEDDATWFTWALGWKEVDHQHGDGNQFELYRKGEWLTKGLVGYGASYGDDDPSDDYFFPSSEYHNTLALENDAPLYNDPVSDRTHQLWLRGSQWELEPEGDPEIVAMSVGDGYVYALGDATKLYNSTYQESLDILHASRSILWLQPDHIVVYDRAASKTEGRFKRFWLNIPAEASVDGKVATMTADSGQQLVMTTLLPTDAGITVAPMDALPDDIANGEPMRYRLLAEAPDGPAETRFLHVLQGLDAGAEAEAVSYVESDDTAFAGAAFGETAVLFPVDIGADVAELTYTAPAGTTRHVITGLASGGEYDVETEDAADGVIVTIRSGTGQQADDGGVLLLDLTEGAN
jgi:hypothetical protein